MRNDLFPTITSAHWRAAFRRARTERNELGARLREWKRENAARSSGKRPGGDTLTNMETTTSTQFEQDRTGMFFDIPMEIYQSANGISKSALDRFAASPLDYMRWRRGELEFESTEAMRLGTAFHSALFENREDYVVKPADYDGRTKAGKEWLAANANRTIVSRDFVAALEYFRRHPLVAEILAKPGARPEVSIFARDQNYGHLLKGRCDWLWFDQGGSVWVADLKTTQDASTRAFSREIHQRRYHVQAAMYRYILAQLGHELGGFVFIAAEKGDAPKCNVRKLSTQALAVGTKTLTDEIHRLHNCRIAGEWPEFSDSETGIGYIDLPEWVYGDVDALEGMTAATE